MSDLTSKDIKIHLANLKGNKPKDWTRCSKMKIKDETLRGFESHKFDDHYNIVYSVAAVYEKDGKIDRIDWFTDANEYMIKTLAPWCHTSVSYDNLRYYPEYDKILSEEEYKKEY